MVGGNEFEKIKKGSKRKKAEGERPKERKKRVSLKNMPLAGDIPALVIPRAVEVESAEPAKVLTEIPAEIEVPVAPVTKQAVESKDEPEAQVKKELPLDPSKVLEYIESKKRSILKRIAEGKLTAKERGSREELEIVFPLREKLKFEKLTEEEQSMLWAAREKANAEIYEAMDKWMSVNRKPVRKEVNNSERRRGQLEADEKDSRGLYPHDAEEALREKPKPSEMALEVEKELDPEELKEVIDDIEGAWKDLAGIYQEDDEDKILMLKGKIAGYGKRQLVNIFGVSKEQADKIVREAIDKIMSK